MYTSARTAVVISVPLQAQEAVKPEHRHCHWASGVKAAAEKGLAPLEYTPLPLGAVAPTGAYPVSLWSPLPADSYTRVDGPSGHLDLSRLTRIWLRQGGWNASCAGRWTV
eukprot:8366825-Pyramimonas_sp.AAC.2